MASSGSKTGTNHFVGIGGSGMSALAQFHAMGGEAVSGSDRLFDRGEMRGLKARLAEAGISLFPQDGSGVGPGTRELTVSTAIEDSNPDIAAGRALGLRLVHRTDALADHVAAHRTLAVAGTSGKSTVTAMVYEVLAATGHSPSLITGAPLVSLEGRGLLGNAYRGTSDFLVIEADESDGTLPKYSPWLGMVLSLGKDHKEVPELLEMFRRFQGRCRRFVLNADYANLSGLRDGSRTFGFEAGDVRGERLELEPQGSRFQVSGVRFEVPFPGRHNAANALAAAAACLEAGVPLEDCSKALASFAGVARRFQLVGTAGGIQVVDDYAHNPDKLRAVLAAGRLRAKRLRVVFQPHGFYPTRFMKDELIEAFGASLRDGDTLWMPDIYYVGGTTVKDISSGHITAPLKERGLDARHVPVREDIILEIAAAAQPGDLVLVLGARDPTLSDFARRVLQKLRSEP
ncbi:MAG: Mur ligase domain-containing protein [Elusimicrobiota bacterium]